MYDTILYVYLAVNCENYIWVLNLKKWYVNYYFNKLYYTTLSLYII